jgi:threonine dehydrogenase-like Zn-dependent dehydrogenase
VDLNGESLFYAHVHLHGGPAPVRRFLPKLIDLVWNNKINPGKVFDLTLPLDQVAEALSSHGRTPGDQVAATSLKAHQSGMGI